MTGQARIFPLTAVLAASLVLLAGCGDQVVDATKTEIAIRYDVEEATGTEVAKVECPRGIAVRPGNRFSCRVRAADGTRALAELEVRNDRADLHLIRLRKP